MEGAEKILEGVRNDNVQKVASGLSTIENNDKEGLDPETGFGLALAYEYLEDNDYDGLKDYTNNIIDNYYEVSEKSKIAGSLITGLASAGAYNSYNSSEFLDLGNTGLGEPAAFMVGYYGVLLGGSKIYEEVKKSEKLDQFEGWDYEEDFLPTLTYISNFQFTDFSEEAQEYLHNEWDRDTYGEFSNINE